MVEADRAFSGSIPALYQQLMVPMLFAPYAADIARRAAALRPRDVLETAAGTGVVTRRLAAGLGPGTRIVATDLNPTMLEVARAGDPEGIPVVWQQADALALPFADAGFDLAVCQFGVMFFPDKTRGYREARRVLRPGGHFLFNVWDGLEGNAFARVVASALAEIFPDDPPRFFERTPHGYHDLRLIAAELEAAGFSDLRTATVEEMSRAPSARDAARAYCEGTPMRAEIEARGGALAEVTAAAAGALEVEFGPGPIEGPIRAFVITARA